MSVVKYDEYGIMDGGTIGLPREMTRDIWLQEVFPEWGTYLNYELETIKVPEKSGMLWYYGAMSCAVKSQAGAVFLIDLYSGPSMFTDKSYCGVCKTCGADKLYWMRLNPMMVDPWKLKRLDAVLITHHHQDHMCFYTVKATLQTTNCKYICPPESGRRLKNNMGVPEDRLIITEPGKSVQIEDMKIDFAPNYDTIATRTGFPSPVAFSEVACSYIFNTPGGNFAFLGDTLYSNAYAAFKDQYNIDYLSVNMGNNAPGYTDKNSPWDVWRIAEACGTKNIVPMHHDNWANCWENPMFLEQIVKWKNEERRHPVMNVITLLPGARFEFPKDNDGRRYMYPDYRENANCKKSEEYGEGTGYK